MSVRGGQPPSTCTQFQISEIANTTDGTEAKRLYAEEKNRIKSDFIHQKSKLEGSIQEFLELEADPTLPQGGRLAKAIGIWEVRGGIKIENRENLGQCPNRGE